MEQRQILEPDDAEIVSAVESILLAAGQPVPVPVLARCIDIPAARIQPALVALKEELGRGVRLQLHANAAQLVTAPENAVYVQRFLGTEKPPPISRGALEALTVIAYRQPVTRGDIESLRGVNSDRAVLTLLSRGLIEERGHRLSPGRPMQYGTTFAFLEYFGLPSLEDLPAIQTEEVASAEPVQLGLRNRTRK